MNRFPKIALRGVSSALIAAVVVAWLLLPGGLSAQTVNVSAGGIISLGGVPPIYNGQYVIQKTDFGFLWLDTVALQGGLVQVEAKCGTGQPPSAIGLYVIGDCNGITNVSSSGNIVLARQFSGQCGAATDGCSGPRDSDGGTGMFVFTLGTWAYQGRTNTDIPDSTQTSDPQGRTWKVTANSLSSFTWTATGGNTPPTATATATNLSAGSRPDKNNYYGDKWQLQDASGSGITNVDWDLIYNGTYARDEGGPPSTEGTITGYFPCDPSGPVSGNIRTGANCIQSLNLTNPATAASYRFAEQSANANGTSANTFISSPAQVTCPQPKIVGYTGFTGTCAKTAGTLNVLVGGNADASGSQGNLAEASFAWTFTGPSPINASTAVVPVPAGDTGFTLTITYPGGYTATASGTIVQSSLVAAFALSPNPVLINTPLTLTNQMQVASGTTLGSVNYVINPATTPGTCDSTFNSFTSAPTLGSSFLAAAGSTTVPAPVTKGGFCVYLRYNYTPSGSSTQQSQIVSNPFSATDWVAAPQVSISPVPFCLSGPCQLSIGTAYSLSDSETIPLSTHPGATWNLNTTSIGTSADANVPITWTPTSPCNNCTLSVTVNGSSASLPVTISNASPTPPPTPIPTPGPPPPSGGLSVSVSGPSSGSKGTPLTYTATASGGTPPYSYQWQCDYNPLGAFTQQGQTATCSYAASGNHNVKAVVRDSASGSALSPDFNVTITGPPPPSSGFSVTGNGLSQNVFNGRYSAPNGTAITFSASETIASSYSWNFADGTPSATTKTAVHTFPSSGPYPVVLTVQGDGINNSGTSSATINIDITGPPRPSTSYTVTGAKQTGTDTYTAESGLVITFTANATLASAFSWDFGDETKSGSTVTKSYPSVGPRTVRLTVTGDGTNTAGTAFVDITMNITPPTFRAAIVPGVAHLDDGTTTWGSDVSITNSGTSPMNISLGFVPLAADAPASLDLTQLAYGNVVALGPGGSYSVNDVVAALNGGNNKGTLVVQYKGGSQAPLVSARVYFQPKVNPGNISYGSGIPAYEVDSSGRISAQGFVSTALSQTPDGATADSVAEALDYGLTVTLTGTGAGTVTSDPAGINCPTTCSATFPVGTYVNLSGAAAAGSTFAGITGCDFYSLGTCTVTMSGQKSVTAKFDGGGSTPLPPASSPTLTVSKTGTGSGTVSSAPSGVNCGPTCSAPFSQGTAVTLSAAPGSGSTFTGWGGACSGTGSCVVTMSSDASVTAGFSTASPAAPQGDQVLIGLVSDPSYRFVVTLFNASGTSGNFELKALDDQGSTVLVLDESGNRAASRKFTNLSPYQQVFLRDTDLGLDPGKHYVLKATATKGTLLAFGTALDRKTNDLVQITDDSQAAPVENGIVSYWVAGVSRIDTYAHWRTDLRIFNRGSKTRNLSFQYSYTPDGMTEHVAEVANHPIAAGQLLTYDDVIATLLALDTRVDLSGNTAGILRIFYAEDDESATRPLVIGSRNYDNEPTGTAGSQLSVYTLDQAAGPGQRLVLAGAEESDRYTSRIGVFAVDPGPVTGRIVAVGPDGTEVGSLNFGVGGSSPHYGQISLTDPSLNFKNPGTPVSIRIDQLSGGRIGAYVFTVDKVTLDTNFIQALPQN
jgi:PKD domain-containing protein/List-Bact-rpt repeat protein